MARSGESDNGAYGNRSAIADASRVRLECCFGSDHASLTLIPRSVTVREIRAALAEEFDVEDASLKEEKKDIIKQAANDAVEAVEKQNAASEQDEDAGQSASDDASSPKAADDAGDGEDEGEGSDAEARKVIIGTPSGHCFDAIADKNSLHASSSAQKLEDDDLSSLEDTDLEDDGPKKAKGKGRKSAEGAKKAASAAGGKPKGKSKASSTGASTGDKDEDEVARLKKFVTACGVR